MLFRSQGREGALESIARARKLIKDRLAEVDEERRALQRALAALESAADAKPATAKGARKRTSRRRAKRGQRQLEFLSVVKNHPGEPIANIAREMQVKPQQLYPIARRLATAGEISELNGGYKAAAKSASSGSPAAG